MFTVTRDQAENARDHAMTARRSADEHPATCRKCATGGVPCALGSMLQRGAAKISKEAEHALAAYLPIGSTVTYTGHTRRYHGREWIIAGLAPRAPWSGYALAGDGFARFAASLPSVELSSREAQRRERMRTAKRAVEACVAVLAKHLMYIDATVTMNSAGYVRVSWTSSDFIRAENRAVQQSKTEAGQYIGAALLLLQTIRANVQRDAWGDVERCGDRARRLREHVKA
ncbi:hypothetical protein [Nonomuraea sp. NPDC050643]|uniref:hypothetical protein n=1 Tax=Nonomuraea sp. NPDC050643 TaxID=3155660 RepID=UPI0033F461D7